MVTLPAAPSRPAELGLPCELTLPRELSEQLRFTPEQFAQLCEANPEAVLELSAEGHLITMTPTGGDTSVRNNALSWQLGQWARSQGGWIVFDSSGGFRLPDGSVLSPDASLVRQERWQALTPEQRRGFPPLCPDLVVELASPSDEGPRGISALRRKMGLYIAGGARIGWLISPEQRSVEIWRGCGVPVPASAVNAAMESERLEEPTVLEGGDGFPELRLELAEIWAV